MFIISAAVLIGSSVVRGQSKVILHAEPAGKYEFVIAARSFKDTRAYLKKNIRQMLQWYDLKNVKWKVGRIIVLRV